MRKSSSRVVGRDLYEAAWNVKAVDLIVVKPGIVVDWKRSPTKTPVVNVAERTSKSDVAARTSESTVLILSIVLLRTTDVTVAEIRWYKEQSGSRVKQDNGSRIKKKSW
jgi:hypothetical protein